MIEDELGGGHCCFAIDVEVDPGARSAPDKINKAFSSLADKGYRFLRPARTVFWKADNSTYWIQWTVQDDVAVLWAYDPVTDKVVEALRVREK